MKKNKFLTNSAKETEDLGRDLAKKIEKLKNPPTIFLEGELGSGKTTFVRGFLKELGIKQKILSPTFTISKKYKLKGKNINSVIHIDGYRLIGTEIKNLSEIISPEEKAIWLIEWPEVLKSKVKKGIIINFKHKKEENEREIEIKN